MDNLSFALVSLCCNNYAKNASEHNATEIENSVKLITLYSIKLLSKCGVSGKDLKSKIATKINESVVSAYKNDIVKDYWGTTRHPSQSAWNRYVSQSLKAVSLLKFAIDLSDNDEKDDIQRYNNIIFILKEVEPSGSYTYSNGGWHKQYINSAETKQKLINQMMECH